MCECSSAGAHATTDSSDALHRRFQNIALFVIDELGLRKLPHTAAKALLEVVMRRFERSSTLLTANRPLDDWGKVLGDATAVNARLDRLPHHTNAIKFGPKSWSARKAVLSSKANWGQIELVPAHPTGRC